MKSLFFTAALSLIAIHQLQAASQLPTMGQITAQMKSIDQGYRDISSYMAVSGDPIFPSKGLLDAETKLKKMVAEVKQKLTDNDWGFIQGYASALTNGVHIKELIAAEKTTHGAGAGPK